MLVTQTVPTKHDYVLGAHIQSAHHRIDSQDVYVPQPSSQRRKTVRVSALLRQAIGTSAIS